MIHIIHAIFYYIGQTIGFICAALIVLTIVGIELRRAGYIKPENTYEI